MSIITISRQTGSLGEEIAKTLAGKLGWELLTREIAVSRFLSEIAGPNEIQMLSVSAKAYLKMCREDISFLDHLKKKIREYAAERSAVFLGFGSQLLMAGDESVLNIRIVAPRDIRESRIKRRFHVSGSEAADIVSQSDRKHKRFVSTVFGADLDDERLYHIILNTAFLSVNQCVDMIMSLYSGREMEKAFECAETDSKVINNPGAEIPVLKNPAEAEFARILDMYQIDWKYEPRTFPIEWDAEGNILLAFSPDFYLTRFNTYIELTTMDQKYITKKNKKIKKLKELYPGINIKLVNKKDYNLLIERFGTHEEG